MTQKRILHLAYGEALNLWAKHKERQDKGRETGYATPIADHWVAIYQAELQELETMMRNIHLMEN